MTTPDPTTGETLDTRLRELLEDVEAEAVEAKRLFERAKERRDRAKERASVLRNAVSNLGSPGEAEGDEEEAEITEATDEDHLERVREARETVPA